MRKLLVSDYDGTFLSNSNDINEIYKNIDVINCFIKKGNLFSIATGRNYNSIKEETLKYQIPYNYLICNNGTSIFDSNDNLIHSRIIPFALVIKIINYLNRTNYIKSYKYNDIFGAITDNFTQIAEIVCNTDILDIKLLEEIKRKMYYLQVIYFTIKDNGFLIIKKHSDKKEAIEFISNKENIDNCNIITVGNDFNDYMMLKCYNGYKMIDSNEQLNELCIPQIESVHKLVKRIEG